MNTTKRIIIIGLIAVATSCGERENFHCTDNASCNLSGGGACVSAPSGNMWCAYPDPNCESGYRYSDQDVGDGLAGRCTEPTPDAGVDDAPIDAPIAPAQFVLSYGGSGGETIGALHTVADGILLTGVLQSNSMFGGIALTTGGGSDFIRAKLDHSGAVLWAKAFNDNDHEMQGGSGVDSAGNLIVAGTFAGSVSFGGAPLAASGYDIFLAKYNGIDGEHMWSVRAGGPMDDRVGAACVDSSGDVYVAGYFTGTTNLGGAGHSSLGLTDGFVAKYRGTDGAFVWGFRVGGVDQDEVTDIACDDTRVVVTGRYRGTANFGGTNQTSVGQDDLFIAAYNAANGNHLWSKGYGSTANDSTSGVTLMAGAAYVTGAFYASLNLGGTALTNQGVADIYVAKYDGATGSHVWSKRFGDTGADLVSDIVAAGPNLTVVGYFNTQLDFGGGDLHSAGGNDIFVATLAQSDGSYIDAWRVGGTGDDKGTTVTHIPTGVVAGGSFSGTVYFGSLETTSNGGVDAFVFAR